MDWAAGQTGTVTPFGRSWYGWPGRLLWPALLGLLALALSPSCWPAGTGDYLVDVWTGEHGLPSSSVTAINQTPDGYLWAGTYNGLVRFDGVRFVTFDPANTPELQHARIRRLYVDAAGTLWINTYDGSLTSYRNRRFHLEWKGDGSPDATLTALSLRSNSPVFLVHTGDLLVPTNSPGGGWHTLKPPGTGRGELCTEDAQGVIWCRGRDKKIWRLHGTQFEAVELTNAVVSEALDTVNCLVGAPDGRVWLGTKMGLVVWDGKRFLVTPLTNGEPKLEVRFLYPAPDGSVWVVADGRVLQVREGQCVFEAAACRGVFTGRLDRLGFQQDRNGGLWIYHYGKGLFHIRPDGRTRQLALEPDFPGERVDCFFEDREGNCWVGVDRGGLVRVREKRFTVLAPDASVPTRAVVSVAEDAQGALWLGTYGGGLQRWQDYSWQSFPASSAHPSFVFSICPDQSGQLWLSADEENLFYYLSGQIRRSGRAIHGVKALLAGSDGRLWVGTKSGLICGGSAGFRRVGVDTPLRRATVRALAEDGQGTIWVGGSDGCLYSVRSNAVATFMPSDVSPPQPIWSLLADGDGTVWAGTFRGGLLCFREGRFTRCTTAQGLPDNVICQIMEDGQGRLWLGSHQGIFCVAKAELRALAEGRQNTVNCTAYGRYDGLPSLECSGGYQPAACHTRDGRLVFATQGGVVTVRPEQLSPNRLPPPVVIEEVRVDGRLRTLDLGLWTNPAPGKLSTDAAALQSGPLVIPPGGHQVEFRFTGLSFVSPDRVRFRYRLTQLDKDWVEAGTRRLANYGFLAPGEYRFEVTACNNDGVWNEQPVTLALIILPHFYQTWWFLVLASVVMAGAVAGSARHFVLKRMRLELARAERQRALEQDRARIAKDIHDDLGAGLTHIALLSEVAQREPSGAGPTHLVQISDTARELTRAMDEIVWAVSPQNDTLEALMTYVCKFAQEYLKLAGIACRLDLPAQLPSRSLSAEVRHNLFLAVKETLTNVVKHSQATEVRVGLALSPAALTLSISDNGRGLATANATEPAPATMPFSRVSSGHGLPNLEKRLAACGGRFVLTSAPGQGTRVELTVPA